MTALAQARVKRLVEPSLLGKCRTTERLQQLRGNAERLDGTTMKKMEWLFAGLDWFPLAVRVNGSSIDLLTQPSKAYWRRGLS
ncbi:MAG: hypothetical protein ACLPY5_06095 [Candidatus Bathyarchaeia archaeon]